MPWLEREEILRFEEIERLVAAVRRAGRRGRAADRRRAAGAPRTARAGRRCWRAIEGLARPFADDQRLPARARGRRARGGRPRPRQRLDRLAAARPLLPDDPPRRPAAGPARARGDRAPTRACAPIKVNAVAMRGFTEDEVAALRRVRPLDRASRCASSSSCRSTPTAPGARPGADRARSCGAMIDARPPARGAAARALGHRAGLPLRRRQRRDRLHQPGLRTVLRRLQPHPPDRRRQAPHLPVLPARDRPAGAAARRRRRRRAGAGHPRGGLAQGAEAPGQRAGLPPAGADDERDRRLTNGRSTNATCDVPDRKLD